MESVEAVSPILSTIAHFIGAYIGLSVSYAYDIDIIVLRFLFNVLWLLIGDGPLPWQHLVVWYGLRTVRAYLVLVLLMYGRDMCRYYLRVFRADILPVMITALIDICTVRVATRELRENFRSITWPTLRTFQNAHSHPAAAQHRSASDMAMDQFLVRNGYDVFSISTSSADDRSGIRGVNCYHNIKNVTRPARVDELRSTDAIKLTDVDYYLDLPLLCRHAQPILMYTFVPRRTGHRGPDCMYGITANDEIDMCVMGNQLYKHQLWNHVMVPQFVVHYWWGSVVYQVESAPCPGDTDRRIVGLFPYTVTYGCVLSVLGHLWKDKPDELQRRKFHHNGYVVNRFMEAEDNGEINEYISVGKPGDYFSATYPASAAYALTTRIKATDTQMPFATATGAYLATINSEWYPKWAKTAKSTEEAVLFVEAATAQPEIFTKNLFGRITYCPPHNYVPFNFTHIFDEVKPTLREVWAKVIPWTTTAVAPMAGMASDKACIKHRIEAPRNKVLVVANKYRKYMHEFLTRTIGGKQHTGVPDEYSSVMERQKRPTQRAIIRRIMNWLFIMQKVVISSFMKREAYGKFAAPRNISTLPADTKVRYSTYMYAFAREILYDKPWYAFSKTPRVIADCVVRVCNGARWVIPTDFSKFDGSHSAFLCEFEETALKWYFADAKEVVDLYKSQYNVKGYTAFGLQYDTGFSRLSGSPETSAFNTLDNAFVAFCALRERVPDADKAYEALGLYGGDDGITANVDPDVYTKVATELGLKLTIEKVMPQKAVPFLSRLFVNPWVGDTGSFTEVKRQLQKLHLTTAPAQVHDWMVLYRKAIGYLLTDRETPILGAWAMRVVQIVNRNSSVAIERWVDTFHAEIQNMQGYEMVKQDQRWFETYDYCDQFPQVTDRDVAVQLAAESLGIDESEVYQYEKHIWAATDLTGVFPSKPKDAPPLKVEIDVMTNNEVKLAPRKSEQPRQRGPRRRGSPSVTPTAGTSVSV